MKNLLLLFSITAIIYSCGSNEECKDCNKKKDEPVEDSTDLSVDELIKKDTTTISMSKEQQVNHVKIVKKYGEQWDFCKCVVALDSINDAVETSKLTDAQFDKLMERFDYVDLKCKEITTFDNQTPDERMKHDKHVMKCLKENGLKK